MFKKTREAEARRGYLGHVLTENRNGLVVDVRLTQATGKPERDAAIDMVTGKPVGRKAMLGADRAYDTRRFVEQLREINVTPRVTQNVNRSGVSAIDARTTRHEATA